MAVDPAFRHHLTIAFDMAILSEDSLDFAREHIERFYDSDFYPKPPELAALWRFWDEVKKELTSKNVSKHPVTTPRAMTMPKSRGGFRVVHQLDPLDVVVYTALAYEIAPDIESDRCSKDDRVACSYRLNVANGSFFADGPGWTDFDEQTEALLANFSHVLVTDISDFYNQIYLHRLNNAIETANPKLKHLAAEIENFLTRLNDKASQGVPVGPAASIVMAEAVLIDVDDYLVSLGVEHTRYVDDIRIFGNSTRELRTVLEKLTLYLYQIHRLSLSSEKTHEFESGAFTQQHFKNAYAEEKAELIESLDEFNPYSEDFNDSDAPSDDDGNLIEAIERIIKYEHLDLGMARSVIRAARRNRVGLIAEHLLNNFDFFAPVVNDVVLYLHQITDDDVAGRLVGPLRKVIKTNAMDSQLTRYWLESYLAQYPTYMHSKRLSSFVLGGPNIENQALAAITTKNVAWVRTQKNSLGNLGGWARRAVLHASRVLPSDERKHWLKHVADNSQVLLDKWVARWVSDDADSIF